MWYAVQVMVGNEMQIVDLCKDIFLYEREDVFVPLYERKKKVKGSYAIVKSVLFPGYVFFQTEDVDSLFYRLKNIIGFTKILRTGEEFVPLHDKEVAFLTQFGGEKHVVELSMGYIEGDRVIITSGPMMNWQGRIKKIDRHKRVAVLEVDFFERLTDVTVGLEIVEKIKFSR